MSIMLESAIQHLRSRFRGCLTGSAIGDAFGFPFEGSPQSELPRLRAALNARARTKGCWGTSDDTRMLKDLGGSLIAAGRFDRDALMKALRQGYDPVRGYGKGMKLIFRAMDQGAALDSLARVAWPEGSRGNGGIVRLPPLVCFYHLHDEGLNVQAKTACALTHSHPEATSASLLFAVALDHVLGLAAAERFSPSALLDVLSRALEAADSLQGKLLEIRRLLRESCSPEQAVSALGHGVVAAESVPAAIYALCATHTGFEDLMLFAVGLGGDSDTIGAMSGALAGALFGFESIPELWLENLERGGESRGPLLAMADGKASGKFGVCPRWRRLFCLLQRCLSPQIERPSRKVLVRNSTRGSLYLHPAYPKRRLEAMNV